MRLLNAAKWWKANPEDVGRWSIVDFMDREEYMLIYNHVSSGSDRNENENDWKGR